MSRIDDALRRGGLTWRPGDEDTWELHGDGDMLGRIRDQVVTIDGHRYELDHGRGYVTLIDAGRRSRLASLRLLGHGAGQVTLPSSRARISKQGVGPLKWEVTDDLSGPQILDILTLFGRVRIKPGEAYDDHHTAMAVLVVFVALVIIPDLRAEAVAATA